MIGKICLDLRNLNLGKVCLDLRNICFRSDISNPNDKECLSGFKES